MLPYRVQYNESEYDIKNYNLFYRIGQQCQNTFNVLENLENVRKCSKISSISKSRIFILYHV